MNKIVYVKAYFRPMGEEVEIEVPTGQFEKGFFGNEKEIKTKAAEWKQTGWSDAQIDGELLTDNINEAVILLNQEGYEVQSILPIISGAYAFKYDYKSAHNSGGIFEGGGWGYGYGYGYSFTEGVTIVARKTKF
ncbi:hypothetical protein [Pseudomonas sp. BF-B-30]|uniref:hypothetical protein n=1 Tax=Pseudomonas sp. BF-B-30 TaxID=2832388 RepID=UPI001CBE192A|nr:hypothetical protein [Pseudomonas sp. BF-B-30]